MINNASIRLQRYTLNQLLWRLCGYNQLFWVDNSCHNNEKHVRQQHRIPILIIHMWDAMLAREEYFYSFVTKSNEVGTKYLLKCIQQSL